ncbi:ankyrin repeat-containing domain protein [Aspergillus germanicus]
MHLLELPLEIFHMILAHTIVQGQAENFTQLQPVNKTFAREALNVVLSRRLFQRVGQWDPFVFKYLCSRALAPDAYHYDAIRTVRQSTDWILAQESNEYSERDICYTLSRSAALSCNEILQKTLTNSTNKCTEAQKRAGKVKTRVLDSALKESASGGHLECMQLLLQSGAPVNLSIPQEIEHTALWYAACHGRNEAIKFLLDRGVDINEGFMWPDAPLVIAGQMGFPRTVALLLERGAQVSHGRVYAFGQIGIISPYCVIKVLLEKEVHKRDEDGAMRMLNEAHGANRQDLIDLFHEFGVILGT